MSFKTSSIIPAEILTSQTPQTAQTLQTAQDYRYESLNNDQYEIRIITILPGQYESPLRCRLEKMSLVDYPRRQYAALSYSWGDQSERVLITIDGIEMAIGSNLAHALRRLRNMRSFSIWADALCINQKDNQEKSFQIRYMTQIYAKATVVYSWLGLDPDGFSSTAISMLKERASSDSVDLRCDRLMEQCRNFSHICGDSACNGMFVQCLEDLFNRPYWKRIWIIQEIAVSSDILVLCGSGSTSITYHEMANARSQFKPLIQSHGSLKKASSFFDRIANIRESYHAHGGISLVDALKASRGFLSVNPRDQIFALVGVSRDGGELVPTPNYRQSLEHILCDLTLAIAKQERLDVIATRKNWGHLSSLPSWASDWRSESSWMYYDLVIRGAKMRQVGPVRSQGQSYDGQVLKVKGATLATVMDTVFRKIPKLSPSANGEPLSDGRIPFQVLQAPDTCKHQYMNTAKRTELDTLLSLCFCLMQYDTMSSPLQYMHFVILAAFVQYNAARIKRQPGQAMFGRYNTYLATRPLPNSHHMQEIGESSTLSHDEFLLAGKSMDQWAGIAGKEWRKIFLPRVWMPNPASEDGPESLFAKCIYWFGKALLSLLVLLYYPFWLALGLFRVARFWKPNYVYKTMLRNEKYMLGLTACEDGLIAAACHDTLPGDKICYIDGCINAVVLREADNVGKWTVVGTAFMPNKDINRVVQEKYGRDSKGQLKMTEEEFYLV